jgi:hypothetical protein
MGKGQVTIFIIVGIVVLIVFGLLFMIGRPNTHPPDTRELSADIDSVKYYVEQCLYDSAVKGLRLLGSQGGVIYELQGGTAPDSFRGENFASLHAGKWVWHSISPGQVMYGLSCAANDIGSSSYKHDRCPSIVFPYFSEDSPLIVFGNSSKSRTHYYDGTLVVDPWLGNKRNLPGLEENQDMLQTIDWLQPLLDARMKVKRSLGEFIADNITGCLGNYSELRRKGLVVTPAGPISAVPRFPEAQTDIELTYPLSVYHNLTGQTTIVDKFSVVVHVRFGKIYKYVNDMLQKQAEDYSFNISSALPRDGIALESLLKDINAKKVDIVSFNDSESWLPDTTGTGLVNYRFVSAIPNSPPAISYIHYRNLSAVPGLKQTLQHQCGTVFQTPMKEDVLQLRVFERFNKNSLSCMFEAYEAATGLLGKYQPAYDADSDELNWSFRISDCTWDEDCLLDNEAEFGSGMNTLLTLRFYENPTGLEDLEDFLTIPVSLYNYAPEIPDSPFTCAGRLGGWYKYVLRVRNRESGIGKDPVELSLEQVSGSPIHYQGDGPAADIQPGWATWNLFFENRTGTYNFNFTITDSFGQSNSTVEVVTIPC